MFANKCVFLIVAVVLVIVSAAPSYSEFYEDDDHLTLPIYDNSYADVYHVQYNPQRVKRQNSLSVGAEHNRQMGTDLNIEAQRRLWTGNQGRSTLDANANYNRHYGGPYGTGRPNYGAGVRFQHRF